MVVAAVFIDFENLFYKLQETVVPAYDVVDALCELLRSLRRKIETDLNASPIIRKAYADFERLADGAPRALLLGGTEPVYVLGTNHKNAADMHLCVDAIETLYTRPEISRFVIAAGDRDYIPVINQLIRAGKNIQVVAFDASLSGDLKMIVGEANIWSADSMLPESAVAAKEERFRLERIKLSEEDVRRKQERLDREAISTPLTPQPAAPSSEAEFAECMTIDDPQLEDALELIVGEYGQHPEIWLRPVLYAMERRFDWMANWEIKEMIEALRLSGAIAVEQRPGDGGKTFSVIRLNYNHPSVQRAQP